MTQGYQSKTIKEDITDTQINKVRFYDEDVDRLINSDLAEGQLNGEHHSTTKYNLDGSSEPDAWKTPRCQLASCACNAASTLGKQQTVKLYAQPNVG